ncbi:MAG: PQQ-binding-like beta-propeller repeat protein [Pseudomonadota bacterium]
MKGLLTFLVFFSVTAIADEDRAIGKNAFDQNCSTCHSENPVPRAMTPAMMAQLPPEKIVTAMTSGMMVLQAGALNEIEKRALAIYASSIPWGSVADDKVEENLVTCPAASKLTGAAFTRPRWSGWGLDQDNTHFQPSDHAHLPPSELSNLELKWAFGYPGATTITTQPAVLGDRIFIGSSDGGGIYALDKQSGCAHWKFETPAAVRAAILTGSLSDGRIALFFGDRKAWYYAVDANTGELIWKKKVDEHPWALVTGSAAAHDGVLYVPVASFEELAGGSPTYECCTFQGSVIALDAETGRTIWKSSVITEAPKKTKKTSIGTQLWAPSGAAIWSQPTLDLTTGALYVTTGDAYTAPAAATSDAILAMDMKTGKHLWHVQTTADDAFTVACVAPSGDPVVQEECGPDLDFGSSAILRDLGNGKRVLLAGQKSGVLHALDPDNEGEILWQKRLSPGGVLGGIEWGFAADVENVYVPISDVWETRSVPGHAGGIYAVNFRTGEEVWNTPAAEPDCMAMAGCNAGQPAAATLTPGIIFSGSMDGHMRAYDPATGAVIWDFDTKRNFDTVNGVNAKGGSIKGAGVTVVDGWIYFSAGYGFWGLPGNVFLAFGPK